MVYIDTDTVADVRGLVTRSLREAVNALNGDLAAHRNGNTSIVPKSQLRRHAIMLSGQIAMYDSVFLYGMVEGYDEDGVLGMAGQAQREVAALYGKDTI